MDKKKEKRMEKCILQNSGYENQGLLQRRYTV